VHKSIRKLIKVKDHKKKTSKTSRTSFGTWIK